MRELRIWVLLLKQSFIRDLEYRGAMILGVIGGLAWIVINLVTLELIFSQTDSLAGWGKTEAFLLFGTYRLIDSLYAMFVEPNLYNLIALVHTGDLDLFLTKPLPARFYLSVRRWRFFGTPDLLVSLLIIFYSGNRLGLGLNLIKMPLFLLVIFSALVISVSIGTVVASLIFWFQGTKNLYDIYESLLVAARVPVDVFRSPLRQVFTLIIPLAFLGTFPAQVFRDINALRLTGWAVLMAGLLLFVSQLVWNRALRVYTSASS